MPLYDELHADEIAEHYARHWSAAVLRCPACGAAIRGDLPPGEWVRAEPARDPGCPCCEEEAE